VWAVDFAALNPSAPFDPSSQPLAPLRYYLTAADYDEAGKKALKVIKIDQPTDYQKYRLNTIVYQFQCVTKI
jgi:hypothetical protein